MNGCKPVGAKEQKAMVWISKVPHRLRYLNAPSPNSGKVYGSSGGAVLN